MSLSSLLLSTALRLPFLIVCLAGLILAIVRKNSLGRAAVPAIVGTALMVASSVLGAIAWPLIPHLLSIASGLSGSVIYNLASLFFNLLTTAGLALTLVAVFTARPRI